MILTLIVISQLPLSFHTYSHSIDADKPKLIIYTEHWPPYQFIDNQGNITGLSVDKVTNTLDSVSWPYEIITLPWARAIFQVHEKPNSLIFSVARFAEREKNFRWLSILAKVKSKLVTIHDKKNIQINTLSDIKNYVTILKRSEASSTYFIKNNLIVDGKVILVTSSAQALHLLSIGRGDIYPTTENSFSAAVKNSPYNLSQFNYIYDFTELDVDLYLATSKKSDGKLVNKIKKLFKQVHNSKIKTSNSQP